MTDRLYTWSYEAPCGELLLGSYRGKLCLCDWVGNARHHAAVRARLHRLLCEVPQTGETDCIRQAVQQLDAYFAGELRNFSVPLLPVGTEFQCRVWSHLADIPYGAVESYGGLARRLGCGKAVRAVAQANGANALSLFLPCHRVTGSDGSLTGYAGGLEAKRFLLQLEAAPGYTRHGIQGGHVGPPLLCCIPNN